MNVTVQVEGLDELRRALKQADSNLVKELRKGLTDAAKLVVAEAKSRAAKGPTGDMSRQIKPSVQGTTARVRATAAHRGFNYPVRHEFGDYKQPFLEPALQAKRGAVEDKIDDVVGRVIQSAGL